MNPAEAERYQAVIAAARIYLDTLAPPLRAVTRPWFDRLAQSEFSRIVVLLPDLLADLLPVSAEVSRQLSLAHFYFWWYYFVQDELLDGDASPAALLSGHLALLKMIETYASLGVTRAPYWQDYLQLAQRSAEAHAQEWQTRFTRLDEVTPDRLERFTLDFIGDRAVPFSFNILAQLHLAQTQPGDSRWRDLPAALRCFVLARQIGDDASDWLADLQAGRLNYVSARLLQRFFQHHASLDLERLTGWQLAQEAFWAEVEQTTQTLHRQARDHLAPYGDCRLQALITQQMAQHAAAWAADRASRANLRRCLGVAEAKT